MDAQGKPSAYHTALGKIADGFSQVQIGGNAEYGKLSFQIGDAGRSCAALRSRPTNSHIEEVKILMQQRKAEVFDVFDVFIVGC